MDFRSIFIGIVLFGMVAAGTFTFMDTLLDNYEPYGATHIGGNYSATYNKLIGTSDMNETASDIHDSLISTDETPSALSFFLQTPSIIWNILLSILRLPSTIIKIMMIIVGDASGLDIPLWIINGVITIIYGIFIFLGLGALMKWKL